MAERYRPGLHYTLLGEPGKTKNVWDSMRIGHGRTVALESKDTITAGDGARRDVMPGKAALATATTQNFFYYLKRHGIDNHFKAPVNETHFAAKYLKMIPVEVVVRRVADGSYLKRNPTVERGKVFRDPVVEFFYKDNTLHDPFMVGDGRQGSSWELYDPSRPVDGRPLGSLRKKYQTIVNSNARKMREQAEETFCVLEEGMGQFGVGLRDMKVEFGIYEGEELMLGDVIDNDSIRLSVPGMDDPSKQRYRDRIKEYPLGCPISEEDREYVMDGYRFTHILSENMLTMLPNPPYVSPYAPGELITDYPPDKV